MSDSNIQKDTDAIKKLHQGFCAANTTADWPFLEKNVAPGDVLVWYNLNQSNYLGLDHIVELWKMLASTSGEGAGAIMEPRDDAITIMGDAALVTYLIHFAADFGSLGKVSQDARCTEVWHRSEDSWKMIHFHCSNYVPGIMGGK